jgi:hypothetical protein
MSPAQKKKSPPTVSPLVPERLAYIFKHRPVLWFEDDVAYDALLADFLAEHTPQSIIEHLDIKEVADAQWEIMRLHRIKKAAIEAELPDVIVRELGARYWINREDLYVKGDKEELKQYVLVATRGLARGKTMMDEVMDSVDATYDALLYRTFVANLLTSSAIDERIARTERRRDDIIKKYEERRRTLTAMKRSLIDGKQAADVTEVSTTELKPGRQPAT